MSNTFAGYCLKMNNLSGQLRFWACHQCIFNNDINLYIKCIFSFMVTAS